MRIILLLALMPITVFAHGDAESTSVGPGKGVESFVENEGFVLSKQAIKRLEIVTSPIDAEHPCNLKSIQVISSLAKKLIYIQRNSRFKPVSANCGETKAGDQVVTKGAEFLRVIEMDLSGGEEDEDEHGNEHAGEQADEHGKEKAHVDGDKHD